MVGAGRHGSRLPLPGDAAFDLARDVAPPGRAELVLEGAAFARDVLRKMYPPGSLLTLRACGGGVDVSYAERKLPSKAALFPARLLFTAETGRLGLNCDAACHMEQTRGGTAMAELVARAYADRFEATDAPPTMTQACKIGAGGAGAAGDAPPFNPGGGIPGRLLAAGLVPLWLELTRVYQAELPALGLDDSGAGPHVDQLAENFRQWRLDLERVWRAA